MVKLKNKIKIINSLPPEKKEKTSITSILVTIIIIVLLSIIGYFSYIKLLPFINAVNINKIKGKKINISKCNTKDYIIINKDKSYTMSLTNNNCEIKYYEGNITIINNEITFNKTLKGTIDSNYNIIINDSIFKSENE